MSAFFTALGKGAGTTAGSAIVNKLLGGSNNAPPASAYRDASYGDIWGKISAAKSFGIHPLYALGSGGQQAVAGAGSPEFDYGSTFASATRQAMRSQVSKEKKGTDPLITSQLSLNKSREELNEAETIEALSRAARVMQDYNNRPLIDAVENTLPEKGTRGNPYRKFNWVVDEAGNLQQVPNNEAGYEMPESLGIWEMLENSRKQRRQRTQKYYPKIKKGESLFWDRAQRRPHWDNRRGWIKPR